ncbi:MAG: CpaF family protein [Coriobacteriia bacterium]|nr:CpaF family protein [Coriobacteriia bacterium]
MRQNIEQLKSELYQIFSPERIAALLKADSDMARKEVEEVLRRLAQTGSVRFKSREQRDRLVALTASEVLGLGVIDSLLADPSVTEIMVNGEDRIFFEREGKIILSPDSYGSEEQLRTAIDRIISPIGRRIDEQNPMVNGRLAAGHRVNAIIPPVSLSGPLLTIRKFSDFTFSLNELATMNSVDARLATLLSWAVASGQNIAVSGGTGSGKTTLLNALSLEIPADERIITIEDSAELKFSAHPHVLRLEARPPNLEGQGEISMRDLVINSLRMRPDRIVVGEVRGAEALEMLQAMNTGHDGSLTTLHANTPYEVITRLITMVGYGTNQSQTQIEAQIAAALDLIVHVQRCSDGKRRIIEVVELCTDDGQSNGDDSKVADSVHADNVHDIATRRKQGYYLRPVYCFEQTGMGDDGAVLGQSRFLAVPTFVDSLLVQNVTDSNELALWREEIAHA